MKRHELLQGVKDFLYGFLLHGMVQEVHEEKADAEDLFTLLVLGETVGLPLFPGIYHLRLVPYCAGRFPRWKRRVLKPRDIFDMVRD
ncbi:MAG: hypothetical protein JRJ26_04580 [Deltaproteobacteria bacterium]|nr:hypothetical protein [Deltaproteobacteria bacterium]